MANPIIVWERPRVDTSYRRDTFGLVDAGRFDIADSRGADADAATVRLISEEAASTSRTRRNFYTDLRPVVDPYLPGESSASAQVRLARARAADTRADAWGENMRDLWQFTQICIRDANFPNGAALRAAPHVIAAVRVYTDIIIRRIDNLNNPSSSVLAAAAAAAAAAEAVGAAERATNASEVRSHILIALQQLIRGDAEQSFFWFNYGNFYLPITFIADLDFIEVIMAPLARACELAVPPFGFMAVFSKRAQYSLWQLDVFNINFTAQPEFANAYQLAIQATLEAAQGYETGNATYQSEITNALERTALRRWRGDADGAGVIDAANAIINLGGAFVRNGQIIRFCVTDGTDQVAAGNPIRGAGQTLVCAAAMVNEYRGGPTSRTQAVYAAEDAATAAEAAGDLALAQTELLRTFDLAVEVFRAAGIDTTTIAAATAAATAADTDTAVINYETPNGETDDSRIIQIPWVDGNFGTIRTQMANRGDGEIIKVFFQGANWFDMPKPPQVDVSPQVARRWNTFPNVSQVGGFLGATSRPVAGMLKFEIDDLAAWWIEEYWEPFREHAAQGNPFAYALDWEADPTNVAFCYAMEDIPPPRIRAGGFGSVSLNAGVAVL